MIYHELRPPAVLLLAADDRLGLDDPAYDQLRAVRLAGRRRHGPGTAHVHQRCELVIAGQGS